MSGPLPKFHPDYVPSEMEWDARRWLHSEINEHWWVNVRNGGAGPVVAPNGDPGAEGHRCRICGEEEWFRGPGY